jgi:hypothetical protein
MPASQPTVEITWTSPFVGDEEWRRLVALAGRSPKDLSNCEEILLGYALAWGSEPRMARLRVERCAHQTDTFPEPHHHWTLRVSKQPGASPPEIIAKGVERVGGREGVLRIVRDALSSVPMPIAGHRIEFWVPLSEYACRVLPREPQPCDALVQELGSALHVEQVGYRLEGGVHGIEEIELMYDHEDERFRVVTKARAPLEVASSERWAPFATQVSELLLAKIFQRRAAT